jgi:hypothetical protein
MPAPFLNGRDGQAARLTIPTHQSNRDSTELRASLSQI